MEAYDIGRFLRFLLSSSSSLTTGICKIRRHKRTRNRIAPISASQIDDLVFFICIRLGIYIPMQIRAPSNLMVSVWRFAILSAISSIFLWIYRPDAILSQSSISPYKGNYRSGDLDNGLCLFITSGVDEPGRMVDDSDCIRVEAVA